MRARRTQYPLHPSIHPSNRSAFLSINIRAMNECQQAKKAPTDKVQETREKRPSNPLRGVSTRPSPCFLHSDDTLRIMGTPGPAQHSTAFSPPSKNKMLRIDLRSGGLTVASSKLVDARAELTRPHGADWPEESKAVSRRTMAIPQRARVPNRLWSC